MKRVNNILWLAVIIAVAVLAAAVIFRSKENVGNYEECVKAGGAIAESYPEQCFLDGKGFSNPSQKL